MERRSSDVLRWAAIGTGLSVCLLAYLHRIPLVFGMAASSVFPLIWAVDAYRAEQRLNFAVAAVLVLMTTLPLLRLLR